MRSPDTAERKADGMYKTGVFRAAGSTEEVPTKKHRQFSIRSQTIQNNVPFFYFPEVIKKNLIRLK